MGNRRIFINACCSMLAAICVSACVSIPTAQMRTELAASIAAPAQLVRHDIPAAPYMLASWQRIRAPGQSIRIYIEGDGLAWLDRHDPSPDPTPTNPVALRLAAQDTSPNVIYLARPCQYVSTDTCSKDAWTGARFSPQVIAAYAAVLDKIAKQFHPSGFELVGYSGGANVAGLLAARRHDVTSLRTVAGDIDNHAFITLHRLSPMPQSLDMADEAGKLSTLPQTHFIGSDDDVVPRIIAQSYREKAGYSDCINLQELNATSHEKGWAERWQELLAIPVACASRHGGN